jgi:predicted transcriptional regulator
MDMNRTNPSTAPLGPLERQLHRAVRRRGTATVREVLQEKDIWQRYNTVLTTLERLFRKGLLGRVLEGKAFRYWVQCSLEEFDRETTVTGLRELLRSEQASSHLSYFVKAVGAEDEKLLDELQTLVERQRAELLLQKSAK